MKKRDAIQRSAPGFWRVVGLLLTTARARAEHRRKRQRELRWSIRR